MSYVILESDDTLRLSADVVQRMAKGWKPLGGVSCYYDPEKRGTVRYAQAMVLEASQPEAGATHTGSR